MRKGLLFLIVLGAAMMTAVSVSGQKQLKKLINAQFAISQFYVDSVNDDRLVEDAIKGMLNKRDPHSTYSNATETKELEEPLQGNFSGIGIQFNMKEDTLYVIKLLLEKILSLLMEKKSEFMLKLMLLNYHGEKSVLT